MLDPMRNRRSLPRATAHASMTWVAGITGVSWAEEVEVTRKWPELGP